MSVGSAIDDAITAVLPGWGASRKLKRLRAAAYDAMAGYAAAEKKRLSREWAPTLDAENATLEADLPTLIARARDATRSNWVASSIVSSWRRHVVGTGIHARANARNPENGDPFEEFNDNLDRIWKRWACDPSACDIEGRKTWLQMQCLAVTEMATAGQSFALTVQPRRMPRSGFPLRIQMMEFEQLAIDLFDTGSRSGNRIVAGIEIDDVGKAVAYWFYLRGHPNEEFVKLEATRVPADRVMHLMMQDRPRQAHGVSLLAPILLKARHLERFEEYQVVRARFQACLGGIVTHDLQSVEAEMFALKQVIGEDTDGDDDGQDAAGNPELKWEPGMFTRLRPGEKFEAVNFQESSSNYKPFVEHQLKEIAAGAGMDMPTVLRDFSGANFGSQRQSLIERNAETDLWQQIMIDTFLRPIRERFITLAVAQGRLDAPDFFTDEDLRAAYLQTEWLPPAKPWIDPLKQASAAEKAIDNIITTRSDVVMETTGRNFADVARELAEEDELLKELGLKQEAPEIGAMVGMDDDGEEGEEATGDQLPETQQDEDDEDRAAALATYREWVGNGVRK